MHVIQVSENFYIVENVLSDELLHKLLQLFAFKEQWRALTDANFNIRNEYNISMRDPLVSIVNKELEPIRKIAEQRIGAQLYQNAPQVWFDHNGYLSSLHKDFSPNLTVNIQVYLTDGIEEIGTHCYDNDTWYSVPYRYNCGYMLLKPTEVTHGMKTPVTDQRLSLYQSFRSTVVPVDIW